MELLYRIAIIALYEKRGRYCTIDFSQLSPLGITIRFIYHTISRCHDIGDIVNC